MVKGCDKGIMMKYNVNRLGIIGILICVMVLSCIYFCVGSHRSSGEPSAFENAAGSRRGIWVPPRDYSEWKRQFGTEEHTKEEIENSEMQRLSELKERFSGNVFKWIDSCTNTDDVFCGLEIESRAVFSGLSRGASEEVMKSLDRTALVCRLDATISRSPSSAAIRHAYKLCNGIADCWWTVCGCEFEAAEADLSTYRLLSGWMRKFTELGKDIDDCIFDWKKRRCDAVGSNFHLSHVACEKKYDLYYAQPVAEDPSRAKPTVHWYRKHLKWARNILNRDPEWAECIRK